MVSLVSNLEVVVRVVFVHGACVRDGAWWWHRAAEQLAARGVASVAPVLPSCGEGAGTPGWDGPGFDDDVSAVRDVLNASDEPTVVVAHSYGGIVTAQAAVGVASVRHLLYVSSYLPEPGESLSSFGNSEPAPFLDFDADGGTFGVRPERFVETFLQDCPPDVATEAENHLSRQTLSVTQAPVTESAWHHVPVTYLVCAQDRGTPAEAQRQFAQRANHVVEIDAGHHPFLSQPDVVAELIVGLA